MPVDDEDPLTIEDIKGAALRGILTGLPTGATPSSPRRARWSGTARPEWTSSRTSSRWARSTSRSSRRSRRWPSRRSSPRRPSSILHACYHRQAKLYFSPSADLRGMEVPEKPTRADVEEEALSLIFGDLLVDFPFRNQASRANALAVMLLPFVRLMISGPTLDHHFTASTEGTTARPCGGLPSRSSAGPSRSTPRRNPASSGGRP